MMAAVREVSMRRLLLLLSLAACTEYKLEGNNDPDGTPIDDTDIGADTDAALEECNGDDDDGDGDIDEDFPDSDADGTADCIDEDCDVAVPGPGSVAVLSECEGTGSIVVTDPWNVDIEWQYTSSGSGVIVMPAIGNLTDDNGDGAVDELDDPDIAFTTWASNTLVALHGDGSGEIFVVPGFDGNAGVTIADVDGDGEPEVIASSPAHNVVAVDGSGAVKWRSAAFGSMSYYPQPAVADLDGDGDVEVVYDVAVVDGATGSTVATLGGISTSWRTPVLADLDQDGTSEIVLGEDVFSHTGALEWSASSSGAGNFAVVVDIDGDVGGETMFVSGSQLIVHDHDGTRIRSVTIPGTNPGPPCAADFDGDGEVEIAIPANYQISVWDPDGTKIWQQPMSDSSGLAGCSGYDVNGDGAYEVLFADEQDFRIYDGKAGTVLYTNPNHSSGTLWEYPVTADVDNDGSAEIVIASNTYGSTPWTGVTVFGHAGSGWPKSGPTWGTHDFAVTNLEEDGHVPTAPDASWLVHNTFRARPAIDDPGFADLVVEVASICVASCETGPIKIAYQVANQGAVDADAGAILTLEIVDGGVATAFASATLPAVPAGLAIDGGVFELTPADLGDGGFRLVVDSGAAVSECYEDNNVYENADPFCP